MITRALSGAASNPTAPSPTQYRQRRRLIARELAPTRMSSGTQGGAAGIERVGMMGTGAAEVAKEQCEDGNMLQNLPERAQHPLHIAADPAQRWVYPLGLAISVGIAYFLAARLSLALLTKPDGVAVFWPASGVAAGVLIALGPSARVPVAIGAMVATIVANLLGDRTLLSSIAFAVCNAAEALITAWLVARQFGSRFTLDRLPNVLGLLAAASVGTAISGIGGTAGFKYLQSSTAPILTTWQHWFASDALGIVTVAPLLIGLASAAREPPSRGELIEGTLALIVLAMMSGLVIFLPRQPWATVVPIALLFPVLLWLSARCRPVFAAAAAFIVALTIVGRQPSGSVILGTPASRWPTASWVPKPASSRRHCAHSFLLHCLPNVVTARLRLRRARRVCRKR